jgi:hypothetical protein
MNDQRRTVDEMTDPVTDPPGGGSVLSPDRVSDLGLTPLFDPAPNGKDSTMSPIEPSEEAPAASLVGSLSVFSLSDVLTLLASTFQTGEFQVVNDAVDGKLWLEGGQFSNAHVGTATTIGQAVFELACVSDGWFYFTAGLTSSSGQPPVPVAAVLDEVRPQVEEWRDLRDVVPLEAVVALSPTPLGQDVQIRSEQWNVLTTVGNAGHSVKTVVDMIGGDQIAGLRALRDLQTAGLIVLEAAPVEQGDTGPLNPFDLARTESAPLINVPAPPPPVGYEDRSEDLAPPPPPGLEPVANGTEDRFGSLGEVAIMPPPIAGDPWATAAESSGSNGSNGSNGNGSGDHGAA